MNVQSVQDALTSEILRHSALRSHSNPDQAARRAPVQYEPMKPIAKAIWYIEAHLNEDVSLDAIAAAAGVSRFHLSRAFPLIAGHPLMRYVRARRLSEAARMLTGGANDILSVALETGYGSHEAFTRAFREHFGATPDTIRTKRLSPEHLQDALRIDDLEDAAQSGAELFLSQHCYCCTAGDGSSCTGALI